MHHKDSLPATARPPDRARPAIARPAQAPRRPVAAPPDPTTRLRLAFADPGKSDPREALVPFVLDRLEGGPCAILPPHKRREVATRAASLGLREFDANLVIAIVQDAVRRGASKRDEITGLLLLAPAPRKESQDALALSALAVVLGLFLLVALVTLVGA